MKRWAIFLLVSLIIAPVTVMGQYYPGKITEYTIGRPAAQKSVKMATKAQLNAVERMRSESNEPLDIKYNENSMPYLISGKFTVGAKAGAGAEAMARDFLNKNRDIFRMRDAEGELRTRSNEIDQSGLLTIRFAQQHNGIPVYGGDLVANFDKEGNLNSVNGNYLPDISLDTAPAITAEEAIGIAKGALGLIDDDIHNTIGPELMIYPRDGAYHLAWCLTLVTKKPFAEWKCFVDAKAGTIIDKWNDTKYQDTMLTGIGVLGETLTVHGYSQNWTYAYWLDWAPWPYTIPFWDLYGYSISGYGLVDTSKAMFNPSTSKGYIQTVSAVGQDVTSAYLPSPMCAHTTTNYTSLAYRDYARGDFSGHYNAGLVYDYWQSHFGRNSINNAGMNIFVNVSCMFGSDATNAMWSKGISYFPEGAVFFGVGDDVTARSQSGSLTCVTHELTHGVTNYTCNLEYKNQSGAINEAFSDSFACALENRWQYNAEGCWLASPGYCRNLENPHLGYNPEPYSFGAMPANMSEYITTDQDNGGVHINMSIISHTFYLICQAIGLDKGEKVWYRTQTAYCTTTTNFSQLRDLALQACSDLYGMGDDYYLVMNSFAAVGIGSGVTIVSKGQPLAVTVAVPPIISSPSGYNAYSIVTMPQGKVLTVWNNSFQRFHGRIAQVRGLPYGYSGYVLNTLVPSVPLGNYLFETALIPAAVPQVRGNATYYGLVTVRVR
ncbi:MAG: M4 family metallopeptidase [Candidatus Aureabacteria bacterium]|nr:M4 family metallopeptidase [Candidatus Auribacterota bacterium]